ncbi:hypothetical protein A9V56_19405 [Salmonella enterica subsp. enterica serovar Typhimurium var. 5-]|nr:hypothetical protein [Salmonella enterica subsp. enterica serovar Typhimurium var. 5-]ECU7403227.1 hypothetical protein [Salmonella enterica subsp. enterica serovar Typhimurium var. 5-]
MLQLCATALNVTCVASLKMNELLKKIRECLTRKPSGFIFSAVVNTFKRCNRKKCERVQPGEK